MTELLIYLALLAVVVLLLPLFRFCPRDDE